MTRKCITFKLSCWMHFNLFLLKVTERLSTMHGNLTPKLRLFFFSKTFLHQSSRMLLHSVEKCVLCGISLYARSRTPLPTNMNNTGCSGIPLRYTIMVLAKLGTFTYKMDVGWYWWDLYIHGFEILNVWSKIFECGWLLARSTAWQFW
jgi:hypothetical protein